MSERLEPLRWGPSDLRGELGSVKRGSSRKEPSGLCSLQTRTGPQLPLPHGGCASLPRGSAGSLLSWEGTPLGTPSGWDGDPEPLGWDGNAVSSTPTPQWRRAKGRPRNLGKSQIWPLTGSFRNGLENKLSGHIDSCCLRGQPDRRLGRPEAEGRGLLEALGGWGCMRVVPLGPTTWQVQTFCSPGRD